MRLILITAAGLALAPLASAQEAMTTGHLAALDTNGDGSVDSAELGDFVARAFQSVDANADGLMTADEAAGVMPSELFNAANVNGDAGISPDEFMNQAQADFAAADRDGNGVLD
jgi:hypothetical protein